MTWDREPPASFFLTPAHHLASVSFGKVPAQVRIRVPDPPPCSRVDLGGACVPLRTWVICHGYYIRGDLLQRHDQRRRVTERPLALVPVSLHYHAWRRATPRVRDRSEARHRNEKKKRKVAKSAAHAHVHSAHAATSCWSTAPPKPRPPCGQTWPRRTVLCISGSKSRLT